RCAFSSSCAVEAFVMRFTWLTAVFRALPVVACCLATPLARCQQTAPAPGDAAVLAAIHDLQQQVHELRDAVTELRAESAQYRAESVALRRQLENARSQPAVAPESNVSDSPEQIEAQTSSSTATRLAALQESFDLLSQRVSDQNQTKVSSGSKYPVRL